MGLAQIPESRGIFPSLTASENLELGGVAGKRAMDLTFERFTALASRRNVKAGLLSGGEQRLLSVARVFAQRPKVLLIDELTAGLSPIAAARLVPFLVELANEHETALLIVDQNTHLALGIAHRAYVLVNGRIVLHQDAALLVDKIEQLGDIYLGKELDLLETAATTTPDTAPVENGPSHRGSSMLTTPIGRLAGETS